MIAKRRPTPSAPARRSQAQRRAETERRVLQAAMQLIAARGLRNVSLRDVGHEAGYSRGIVNHHFGTKEELIKALIVHAQSTFALPETDASGLDLLTLTVKHYIEYLRERAPVGQAFLLLWAEAVGSEPSLRETFMQRDTWFRDQLAEHVRDGIRQGSIRADADPDGVATTIVGMLRGVGLQLMLMPDDEPLDHIRDAAVDTIRHALAADAHHARPQTRSHGCPSPPVSPSSPACS